MVIRLLACLLCLAGLIGGEAGYRLFPGDLIRIEVFGHADLQVDARVPAGGDITYPLIGALAGVAGRSPESLAGEITTRLADGYIRSPSVTVQVREYGPRSAWVIGAVKTPGAVRLDPLQPSSALQAIGACGGFDEDADRGNAVVVRGDPATSGSTVSLPLPAQNGPVPDLPLAHGDVIVVPRADRVFVLGQVQAPRAIPLPAHERLTVSKAISLAGGFGRFARESHVQLVRAQQQPVIIDVRAVLNGSQGVVDPELRAGDTVFIPESRF